MREDIENAAETNARIGEMDPRKIALRLVQNVASKEISRNGGSAIT